jgi:hypothetical protein
VLKRIHHADDRSTGGAPPVHRYANGSIVGDNRLLCIERTDQTAHCSRCRGDLG